jgi:2-polyprenyl-3-methyl-5-hydroxy-6-metoxy-1,4-benzoquinol methylase
VRRHAGTAFIECRSCGYGVLESVTSVVDYWTPDEDATTYWTAAKRRYFDSALELLSGLAPGRRLLDFGGGIGYFTERALAAGWDAVSLDVSETATARAAERLGAGRAWSSLPDEEAGSFDAVTLWCVVAHTTDPGSLLAAARSALRPGGVVWATTPNFAFQKPYAGLSALAGRKLDFAAHDHVGHFSPRR